MRIKRENKSSRKKEVDKNEKKWKKEVRRKKNKDKE